MSVTKYVLPVVVASMSGMILITIGEMAIRHIYPTPAGTDLYEVDMVIKYYAQLPQQAFAWFLGNYIICSFLAGLIGALVAGRTTALPSVVAGIVLTLAGLYKTVTYPEPIWFAVGNMLVYIPLAYLGYLAVRLKAPINQA